MIPLIKPNTDVDNVDPVQIWKTMRLSPAYTHFVDLVQHMGARRLEEYIVNPASEYNRGRVAELCLLHKFLQEGVIQE